MSQSTPPSIQENLLAVLHTLRRRRVLFVGAMATLLVAAAIAVFSITPRYTAQARVMIDPRQENIVSIQAVLSGLAADDPTIRSEIEVLRSEDLARRVIAHTELDQSREFNPDLSASLVANMLQSVDWPWLNAGFGQILAPAEAELTGPTVSPKVVGSYFKRLDVETLGRNSRVIGVSFTSKDPSLAAAVANTIAEVYVDLQIEIKLAATERAARWLEDRLAELGEEVTVAERTVDDLRAARAAAGGFDPDLLKQQIAQVNGQLTQARAALEEARARLRQIDRLVSTMGAEAVFEVVDPRLLVQTNDQLMWLRRAQAELRAQYGPDTPAIAEVSDAIRDMVQQTSERLIASARNRVEVEADTVRGLERELRRLVESSIASAPEQLRLRIAEREARATVDLYETLLTRSKETAQTGLEQADARIISHASVPHGPSYPNRLLLLGIALVGSIAISGSLVGAAEALEKGYRDSDRIRRDLSLATVGEVPWVSAPPDGGAIANLPVDDPAGALAESLRSTALALELFGPPGDRGNIVLITSSIPAEGKTTIITCLARTLALAGRKVLVVDADLRRPNCHYQMHLDQRPGLTSYLSNRRSLEDIVQEDETTGVDLIAAGEVPENPLKLLRSAELALLLREMRPRYDVILIDSPPLLPIADTRLLSVIADRSVLVVQWRVTPRDSVQRAIEQLEQAGGRPDGIILTQLRERTDHGYGYYYASYRAALEKEQAL